MAVEALARRDLTAAELSNRLARAGFSAESCAEVMARLHEAGYLDDARAARERARHLAERGYGNAAIGLDLERRGIPWGLADEATAALEPEEARARRLACSLGGGDRAARALARKGFEQEAIEQAISAVANDC